MNQVLGLSTMINWRLKSCSFHSQHDFYELFIKDLTSAKSEVLIESPFITIARSSKLLYIIRSLTSKGVVVTVNTRNPAEHEVDYERQALEVVSALQSMNVKVFYTVKLHRKLAVIDKKITWQGSLNILSFSDSCELMSRMCSRHEAVKLLKNLNNHKPHNVN